MKPSKITKVLLLVQLVLLICICCTPSKSQLYSTAGLWGRRILLNRVRDFCLIPVSFGTAVCLLGSACPLFKKVKTTAKLRRILFVISVFMTVCGVYWTVRIIRMERILLMPTQWWLYVLRNPFVFSLWWIADGILVLFVRPDYKMPKARNKICFSDVRQCLGITWKKHACCGKFSKPQAHSGMLETIETEKGHRRQFARLLLCPLCAPQSKADFSLESKREI